MTDHNPSAGNDLARLYTTASNQTAWPEGFRKRLAKFAKRTNTTPPARPFEGEGADRTFSTEFLAYCEATGLSLDWVYHGDPMSLVIGSFHQAPEGVRIGIEKRQSLDDCGYDAIIPADMVQALDLLDHEGKEYKSSRAAVTTTALRMAGRLANDVSNLADKERRHA